MEREKKDFALLLKQLSTYYGYEMSDDQFELYLEVLSRVDYETCKTSVVEYMSDFGNSKFPIPIHIVFKYLNKGPSPTDIANDVVGRINYAISKFGLSYVKEAKEYIGEYGVEVCEKWGGYHYLAMEIGRSIDQCTFNAQAREFCKSIINMGQNNFSKKLDYDEKKFLYGNNRGLSRLFQSEDSEDKLIEGNGGGEYGDGNE